MLVKDLPLNKNINEFGDGTNQSVFSDTGVLTMEGTARVLNAIWIDAGAVKVPTSKPASIVDHGIGIAWEFSDATDDTVVFNMRLSNRMDRSVTPVILIGWSSAATEKVGVWQLEYLYTAAGEDTTAAADDTVEATGTTTPAQTNGFVASIFSIAAPGANDICIHCRLKRLGADGDDTLSDTAELLGLCMQFTSNKQGTAT